MKIDIFASGRMRRASALDEVRGRWWAPGVRWPSTVSGFALVYLLWFARFDCLLKTNSAKSSQCFKTERKNFQCIGANAIRACLSGLRTSDSASLLFSSVLDKFLEVNSARLHCEWWFCHGPSHISSENESCKVNECFVFCWDFDEPDERCQTTKRNELRAPELCPVFLRLGGRGTPR